MTCCWWCTLDIKGDSLGLPYKYDPLRKRFKLVGQFCSWECMKAYNIDKGSSKFGEIQTNMTLLRHKMYGKVTRIYPAPHRYHLKKFGGEMTDEEFKTHTGSCPPPFRMPETERFIHEPVKREYVNKVATAKDRTKKMEEIKTSAKCSEPLRLKRPIPIKHNSNNIAAVFGFEK